MTIAEKTQNRIREGLDYHTVVTIVTGLCHNAVAIAESHNMRRASEAAMYSEAAKSVCDLAGITQEELSYIFKEVRRKIQE
jgi:hypothetical protein